MKNYLAQFRDQVFNGSLSLYKRIFLRSLVINFFISLISVLAITPLILKMFNWSFSDLLNLQTRVQEISELVRKGEDPATAFDGLIGNINYLYALPMFLIAIFISIWSMHIYYQLNDQEIRYENRSIITAIKNALSPQLFRLLAYMILYYLLCIASVVIFMFIVVLLMQVIQILGILIGFVGFFFLLFFMARFSLGFAAIVHGKMSVSDAFAYSFHHINMKRAAMLLLMGIMLIVVFAIVSGIGGLILNLFISSNADPMIFYSVKQVFGSLMSAVVVSFIYTSSSALYFRYSNDSLDEDDDDISEHLIKD